MVRHLVNGERWQITALPPHRADAVASMIVALGDARVGVTHAEPAIDDSGGYVLTVDHPRDAIDVLAGLGCVVQRITPERTAA